MSDAVRDYLTGIDQELRVGGGTEHTHRPALKTFVEAQVRGIIASNERRRVECGAPDFTVSQLRGPLSLGWIECKDIATDLDREEKSEQLRRYLRSLHNLVLTDYLEFRWYVEGKLRTTARVGRLGRGGRLVQDQAGSDAVVALLRNFLSHKPASIDSPRALAERMARITHMIRDIIVEALEKKKASEVLRDLRTALAQTLIPDIGEPKKVGEFADMYAQTLAYGLFAARYQHDDRRPFRRSDAASEIPKTNPFLRKIFSIITGPDLDDEPYVGFVDDLVQVLASADMPKVLAYFSQRGKRQDPIVHFYETFLATYDPKIRELRGVYYTPAPVVSYIVRSVDNLLQSGFGIGAGLADTSTIEVKAKGVRPQRVPRVLILDPACGTGTFLYFVIDQVRGQFMEAGNAGMWPGYVREQLLPRIFGFELLMAPYAVAHLKLGMQLAAQDIDPLLQSLWRYDFSTTDRLGIYLTNTLEEAEKVVQTKLLILGIITEEARAAAKIKQEMPILVVMGNPPYSGHSANRSWEVKGGKRVPTFIGKLIQDYFYVDGKRIQERNPKWLQDDYVKFMRWGQWRIGRSGCGVLALITNHGYLDNPTFRGMRQQLMKYFDEIYVLNLHGNIKKRETTPDGAPDQNVFDIKQSVAIGIFVRKPRSSGGGRDGKVYHADLWGERDDKYEWLMEHDVADTKWRKLDPRPPFYLFMPQRTERISEYQDWPKLTEIMPASRMGMNTHRDKFVIDFDKMALADRIQNFRDAAPDVLMTFQQSHVI